MAQVDNYFGVVVRGGDESWGKFTTVEDATNDSDKTITVPAKKLWVIECIHVELTTTADVGNRQMTIITSDGTEQTGVFNADSVQAASGTEYYNFSPHYATASEAPATFHYAPLPVHTLGPGSQLRIYDSAAVKPANDDMVIVITGQVYDV